MQPKEVEACASYDTALLEILAPGIPISVDGTREVEEECSMFVKEILYLSSARTPLVGVGH